MQEDNCCKNVGDFIIELNSNLQILVIFHAHFLQHMHLCVSFNSSEQHPIYNIILYFIYYECYDKIESAWVFKACRKDVERLCRAEQSNPGTFLSVVSAGKCFQSRISRKKHFSFAYKNTPEVAWEWIYHAVQRIRESENQDQGWVRKWDDDVSIPPRSVHANWGAHRGLEKCWGTQYSNAVTTSSTVK